MLDTQKLENETHLVSFQKFSLTVLCHEQIEGIGFFIWNAARYANDQKDSCKPAVSNRHLAIAPMIPQTRSTSLFFSGVFTSELLMNFLL